MKDCPPLQDRVIEPLAKELAEMLSGSDIDRYLQGCQLVDNSRESTKWRRLNWVFRDYQSFAGRADAILNFIEIVLNPVFFTHSKESFEAFRKSVNTILAFSGINIGPDGLAKTIAPARTLDEAEIRALTLQEKIEARNLHAEVTKYCKAELLQDNYFHAVVEATKGLAERIRTMSDVDDDGARLVDTVFSAKKPVLVFNSFRTESERNEHKGLAAMIKGCLMAVRNPLSHEPKIHWEGEDDTADYLSIVSLLHRKLDDCRPYCGQIGP